MKIKVVSDKKKIEILERRRDLSEEAWLRAAKKALEGDDRELRNRVDMVESEPLQIELSILSKEETLTDRQREEAVRAFIASEHGLISSSILYREISTFIMHHTAYEHLMAGVRAVITLKGGSK